MGELGRDSLRGLRGVGVTVPVTGCGYNEPIRHVCCATPPCGRAPPSLLCRQVREACKNNKGFYLGSIGGPAAVLAQDNIKKVCVCVSRLHPRCTYVGIWMCWGVWVGGARAYVCFVITPFLFHKFVLPDT
jgi:hypothetical protein